MIRGHAYEVLHCNYDGEINQKLDLVITFDLFRDTPLDHIWSSQKCIFGQNVLVQPNDYGHENLAKLS